MALVGEEWEQWQWGSQPFSLHSRHFHSSNTPGPEGLRRLDATEEPAMDTWKWISDVWKVPELTAVEIGDEQNLCFLWFGHCGSRSCFLLKYYGACALHRKAKIAKKVFGKRWKPLGQQNCKRRAHREREGGLLHCVTELSKQAELLEAERAPSSCHTLLPVWNRHLRMEWKPPLKARIIYETVAWRTAISWPPLHLPSQIKKQPL